MSVHRSATKRVPNGAAPGGPKPKKGYEIVQQGIKELYPQGESNVVPDIDIVFVPGLGANPEESWKSVKTDFNWASDKKDGLAREFPKARILLYLYESAWTGSLKVKQFMGNISSTLLHGLKSKREKCPQRPIVFIGHSMGGLVIAKAVTIADYRRDLFPKMFESIAGCVFFGTPFHGAPVAAAASMLSQIGEKFDVATASKLLDLMKPGDEALSELRNDFMRLVGKLSQRIELFCFWESQPTDFTAMAGLPALFGLSKALIPKNFAEFVNRDSATLTGIDSMGLASSHRDLVKFDDFKDPRYQLVREPLKRIIHGAHLVVKNRLNSTRDIDRDMVNNIMDILDGAQVPKKRKSLEQTFAPSSWIPKEQEYLDWLSKIDSTGESAENQRGDSIWIKGPEGRGKTSATIAALNEIDDMIRLDQQHYTGQAPILLAYFFCDSTPDYSTAEDLLKSLVRQLVKQQEALYPYAKHFAKKKGEDTTKSQAKLTVENLWQSLQDMLADEFAGRRVYFVINNLHALAEDADSTVKLMQFINGELQDLKNQDPKRVPVKWMFTSRESHQIEQALKVDGARLIDLEDEKYGNQVQLELRKHAQKKVAALGSEKKYNKALAYFASSLIGKRASNSQWIDITCVQLEELNEKESDLEVRRVLENMPQDLKSLLERAWLQIFDANAKDVEKIKEMLRTLVLTYEDPTEEELGVLAGLSSTEQEKLELRGLVEKCRPLLTIKRTSKTETRICFMNIVVKTHLLEKENAKKLLGLSEEETKWQHGVLALRSFSHVMEAFDFPEPEKPVEEPKPEEPEAGENDEDGEDDEDEEENEDEDEEEDGEDDDEDEDSWDEESEDYDEDSPDEEVDPEAEALKDKALAYTVKHWLHHASKATLEIAEDLSLETDFWKPGSIIRRRWLCEYSRYTLTFTDFDFKSLTGLHVAASIGFRQLVVALVKNGHEDEISIRDSLVNTPLHFAAHFGRPNIVEELLNRGAAIDDAAEIHEQTPLHMAAYAGHVKVMNKLIRRGANPNAVASDVGPVVNAAICSGNREAVKILVEKGVSLTEENEDGDSPLALAALFSDLTMFEYLVESYADKLPAQEYDKALVKAAEAGRVEVFNRLLPYKHTQECFQEALEQAAEELNWDIVLIILEHCQGLECNDIFYEAATGTEQQDRVLEAIWRYTNGSITAETLNNSLYDATDTEKLSTVKLLIEKFGASPNATGEEFGNALTAAAYDGTMDIIKLLLDHGANVNSSDGWALQTAAAEGHFDVVKELLARGADVNALATDEQFPQGTALQAACEAGVTEIVELLLEHNANPNLGAGDDTCPAIAAARRGEEKILELLVKAKADVNVFGGWDNSTVLINAAAYLPQSSLRLLLDAGANINLTDEDGNTALIVAAERGDEECVQFLLDNGADIMHVSHSDENALQAAFNNDNQMCMGILVEKISGIMATLQKAMESGNTAVSEVIRSVGTEKEEVDNDEEPQTEKTAAPTTNGHQDPVQNGDKPRGVTLVDGAFEETPDDDDEPEDAAEDEEEANEEEAEDAAEEPGQESGNEDPEEGETLEDEIEEPESAIEQAVEVHVEVHAVQRLSVGLENGVDKAAEIQAEPDAVQKAPEELVSKAPEGFVVPTTDERIQHLSRELESALANQASLLSKYKPEPEPERAAMPRIVGPPSHQQQPSWASSSQPAVSAPVVSELPSPPMGQQSWTPTPEPSFSVPVANLPSPPVIPPPAPQTWAPRTEPALEPSTAQWIQQAAAGISDPSPSPSHVPIRRKPAPSSSYNGQSSKATSPRPSDVSGNQNQTPPGPPTTFEQMNPMFQSQPPQKTASPYQGPPQLPPQGQFQGMAQQQNGSPFQGSPFRPVQGSPPQQLYNNPQQNGSQIFRPSPEWQNGPGVQGPVPSGPQFYFQPNARVQTGDGPGGPEGRPELKNQRSSFFGKAKQLGTGMLNRKQS